MTAWIDSTLCCLLVMLPCLYTIPVNQVDRITQGATDLIEEGCQGTHCYFDPDADYDTKQTEVSLPKNFTEAILLVLPRIEESQKQTATLLNQIVGLLQNQLDVQQFGPSNNCHGLVMRGSMSGTYEMYPGDGLEPMNVYCDMETNGGGWTVFQRRYDGSVNFYRGWEDYENGFGSADGEYWMGLRDIYRLTTKQRMVLRIDMESFDGDKAYAEYDSFAVGNAEINYQLTVGSYTGTAGDSLSHIHNNKQFSTKDRDNDHRHYVHCAQIHEGGWWYGGCRRANLNGPYVSAPGDRSKGNGMIWDTWKGMFKSLKHTEMKIRPA